MSSCQDLPGLDGIFFLSRAPLRRGSFLHALLRARSSGQEILQDVFPIGGGERLLANQALVWPMRRARLGLYTHDLVTRLTPRADEIGLMALSHESPFNFMFSGVPLTCAFQLHLPWDAGWHKRLWDTNEIPQAPSAVAQRRTLELLAAPSQRLLIDSVLRSRIAEAFVGGPTKASAILERSTLSISNRCDGAARSSNVRRCATALGACGISFVSHKRLCHPASQGRCN